MNVLYPHIELCVCLWFCILLGISNDVFDTKNIKYKSVGLPTLNSHFGIRKLLMDLLKWKVDKSIEEIRQIKS